QATHYIYTLSLHDALPIFTYTCYVSSDYLNEHVRSERTSFDIAENVDDLLNKVSFKDIRDAVLERTREYLQDVLAENVSAGRKRDRKSTRLNSSHVKISYA